MRIFARPSSKEKLIWFFPTIFGPDVVVSSSAIFRLDWLVDRGTAKAVPRSTSQSNLKIGIARRGASPEDQVDDPSAWRDRILESGLSRLKHVVGDDCCVAAPGGHIGRIATAQ